MRGSPASAATGDVVWLPACNLPGDHVVPAGVGLVGADRDQVILTGQLSLGASSMAQSLTVSRPGAGYERAMVGGSGGKGYVINCKLSVVLSSGTPACAESSGADVILLYSDVVATSGGAAQNPFPNTGSSDRTTWDFTDGSQGWYDLEVSENLLTSSANGKLEFWPAGNYWAGAGDGWRYNFNTPIFLHTTSRIEMDYVHQVNSFVKFDAFITLASGRTTIIWYTGLISTGHKVFEMPDTVNLGYGVETTEGA